MTKTGTLVATLDAYADAYCAKDVEALMAVFDTGEDITLIGTGHDELCTGPDEIRAVFLRNFEEATATRFEWHWTQPTVRGDTAVIAVSLSIHLELDGSPLVVPIRWTVAAHHVGGHWRWLHRHASAAASSQEEGTAYPTR